MTDTTDIAALLGNLKFYAGEASCHPDPNYYLEFEKLCTPSNILTVAGVLEAERQRADAAHKYGSERDAENESLMLTVGRLRKEIAALKSAHGNMVARCALLRQRTDLPVDRIPAYNSLVKAQEEVTELREKLANPVVLPSGYSARAGHPFHEGERNVMIQNKHGDWLSRFDVEHAIHVAGFPFTNKDE